MEVDEEPGHAFEKGIEKEVWPPSNHNSDFNLELPAIATGTECEGGFT